ncbi:MAG: FlgD immunoglobulin-like domain containing protein, partial [Spirochaetota bacterium]
ATNGVALPEGGYQARLSVRYQSGFSPAILSPVFIIDLSVPSARVKSDLPIFNPAGSVGQDRVTFTQVGTKVARWTGEIRASDGSVKRSWTWNGLPDGAVSWDGSDDAGAALSDGIYTYRLRALDRAGNSFLSDAIPVILDAAKKATRVSSDLRAFSPTGNSARKEVKFSSTVQSKDRVVDWNLSVYPSSEAGEVGPGAAPLRSWSGAASAPDLTAWDGRQEDGSWSPDGYYVARLVLDYANGDNAEARTPPILLDSQAPSIAVLGTPRLFSPNGTSRIQSITIRQQSLPGDDWTGTLFDPDGAVVRSWSWKAEAHDVVWDGTDESGNKVEDGDYSYEVVSVDTAGNRGSSGVPRITVDARVPQVFVTASASGLSPNGDGFMDDIAFSLIVNIKDGIGAWRYSLLDARGLTLVSFGGMGTEPPPRLAWDGKTSGGEVREGKYTGLFEVEYEKGDIASAASGTIIVDTRPPRVDFGIAPDFFSPDNDGVDDELIMGIAVRDESELATWKLDITERPVEEGSGVASRERLFASWSGRGAPAGRIPWDGRSSKGELVESATDYPVRFEIADAFGNKTVVNATVAVDVLVMREGDRLKIKVPSIVWRPDSADFNGLDPAIIANNRYIIGRLAEILNRFADYRVAIEAHTNNKGKISGASIGGINDEELRLLIPLTTSRAGYLRTLLTAIAVGVDARRFAALGLGSSQNVVDFNDAVNRWKNDRVEFILIRNIEGPAGNGG